MIKNFLNRIQKAFKKEREVTEILQDGTNKSPVPPGMETETEIVTIYVKDGIIYNVENLKENQKYRVIDEDILEWLS